MLEIKKLIVHQSVSPNNLDDARFDTAADIHLWHRRRGWSGIGYHVVILEDGSEEMGRPEYWQGAHCPPYNGESLGVCLIGKGNFHSPQMCALAERLKIWKANYPNAEVGGHRDFVTGTECPGFDVKPWWKSVLEIGL